MAKVLLALFIGLLRRRPLPVEETGVGTDASGVAPGTAVSGLGGEPGER
jgi:hypothetical protein